MGHALELVVIALLAFLAGFVIGHGTGFTQAMLRSRPGDEE